MADCRSSSDLSGVVSAPDDDEENVPKDEFSPREYQVELFEAAVKENTIVCLGTGTGKTFIAVMLIKEYDAAIRIPFEEGGKRTFFLVPTVPLVVQQQKAIKCQTDLRVGGYVGDMNVDNWSKERWLKEFIESQVLVMTPDVFKVIIHHGFLELSRVNLLIMDECHRAVKQHTYREVMRCMDVLKHHERPRVLGLTASVINSKATELQVERKIHDLEVALSSRVLTVSNQESMAKYGTKPTEVLVEHRTATSPTGAASIQVPVIAVASMKTSQGQELLRRQRSIVKVLQDLGVWCTKLAIEVIMEEARRMLESLDDPSVLPEVTVCLKWLDEVQRKCTECIQAAESADLVEHPLLALSTPKLRRLLEILWEFRPRQSEAGAGDGDTASEATESLCGIIFVKERIVARVLRDWLYELACKVKRYAYVKPEFIVGHGANLQLGSKEAGMSFKRQCKVLEQFRHQECNLLVATSVVEEGMDVPKCSLVVRFDFPDDFRSYIQSKGRARARKSLYAMMTSSDDYPTNCGNLRNYLAIEATLMTKCHERAAPLSSEVVLSFAVDQLLPPYMPVQKDGAPRITLGSAIGLVNRYCMVLPSDMFTHLKPTYDITTMHFNDKEMFVCTVYLPMTSPLKEAIRGRPMETKRYAKMAAALETCKRLHLINEFDSSLLPVKRTLSMIDGYDDMAPADDNGPPGTAKPGSKKRRRTYQKRVCKLFATARVTCPGQYRLHVLTTKLVSEASELQNWRQEKLFDPQDCPLWFGLLLRDDMPSLPCFPIFTRSGEELVSVLRAGTVSLSAEECNKLQRFQHFMWNDVLRMRERPLLIFDFNAAPSGPVIAPVLSGVDAALIDWSFVDIVLKGMMKRPVPETGYKFESHIFDDAIVVPRYTPLNYRHHTYYLKRVRHDLTVDSEEGKNTFREYLTHVHNLHVTNSMQPLLEVFFTEVRLNLLTPRYRNRKGDEFIKKTAVSKRTELRVPEFCDVHPVPASIWRKAVCLPSIIYRLNQLLLMEELRSSIAVETGIGLQAVQGQWPNLDFQSAVSESASISFGTHDEVEFGTLLPGRSDVGKIRMPRLSRSFEYQPKLDGNPGPSPGLLLEAMTSAKAADGFDLERLEVLGDSFLKFAVTIDLYCGTTSAQEGLLTQTRSHIICNRNLHHLGCKMHVGSLVAQEQFAPHRNWLPPGYYVKKGVEDTLMDTGFVFWMFQKDTKILEKLTAEQLFDAYQEYQVAQKQPNYSLPPNNTSGPVPICVMSQLPDKSVADSVEAIIGAYLLVTGPVGALRVMKWMGLKLPHCELGTLGTPLPGRDIDRSFMGFPAPRAPLLRYVHDPEGQLRSERSPWHGAMCLAERTLGYTFRDKAFLLQACTHASYYRNRLTDCYQRLEFLGDAVIDYLVTRYLYEGPHKFNPGQLTDLRSSLVNNTFFAALVVRHGLQRCLLHCNPGLFNAVTRFVQHQARLGEDDTSGSSGEEDDTTLEILDLNAQRDEVKDNPAYWQVLQRFYYHEEECLEPEEVEVPKALGDLFESLMGAVFLDCGMSLDVVWRILYRFFGHEIESFPQCVPLPPIRALLERFPSARFSPAEVLKNDKVKVELTLGDQKLVCIAKSKKLAKTALAKKCLRMMKRLCVSA